MNGQGFSYRGFMLDSVRHFMPAADVRKLILGARACGMNRMHWHLTDDQGWRIMIRKYPLLTETGAVRGRTFFGGVSETENNNGYYTQDEIREIVRFAGENGMEIIPEVEIPGHASAMLTAYPAYGCGRSEGTPWKYRVETAGGIFPNLVCAGRESTVRFIEEILDEVMELFPGKMIHIGGDEALKLHWRRCPDCREMMREKGFGSEEELQRGLVLRIGAYLAEKGRDTVVWNDVLEGGMLPPHFIVQQWMGGEEKTRQFMAQGGRVINSDNRTMYFDYPYGFTDVRKIWRAKRIPGWAESYEAQLLGTECPLWTERVTNPERAAFLLFPRLAAAGLKAAREGELSWEGFREQVNKARLRIETLGLACAPEAYWDMPQAEAEADIQADRDRIYAPEALPFVRQSELLTELDRTERRLIRDGAPAVDVIRDGDLVLEAIEGIRSEPDAEAAGRLLRRMADAPRDPCEERNDSDAE